MHPAKGARRKDPLVQRHTTNAQWVRKILLRAGTEAVNRYSKTTYAKPGHEIPFAWSAGKILSIFPVEFAAASGKF
jgi:hypothetical protein